MKKIILIITIFIFLSGVGFAVKHFTAPTTNTGAQKVEIIDVTLGDFESLVTAQGTLEPKDYVDVGAQISGLVERMHVDVGDTVAVGQLIAEIDPDVYESKVRADEARLKTLQAQKAEQKALLRQAKQKLERSRNLYKAKAVSQEIFQDAETSYAVAEASLMALDAQIEESQSTLEGDKTNLSYTKIYAPMDGTVVSQSVQEGQTINANQTAPVIVQVANLNTMTVKAQVAEADIMQLSLNMPMYFTTLGAQNRKWEGQVRQILPSPETVNDVVLYNVLVDVENPDQILMTGMTAQIFFVLARAENLPIIPKTALGKRLPNKDTEDGQAYQVKIITAAQETENRTVIVSLSDRSKAVVVSGLSAGERLLISGQNNKTSSQTRGRGLRGMARL